MFLLISWAGNRCLAAHVVFSKQGRIVVSHLLVDKHEHSLPQPARFVANLVFAQVSVNNPHLFLAHQANNPLPALGHLWGVFHTRFISLSHNLLQK